MAPRRSSDVLTLRKPVDLKTTIWVDYFADPRFRDEAVLTDEVTFQFDAVRAFADSVTVTDSVRPVIEGIAINDEIVMMDAISITGSRVMDISETPLPLIDAGFVTRYDYATLDYFLTPTDYVGETRYF